MARILILVICLIIIACKSTKETTNPPDKAEMASKEVSTENYKLVVSFFSPGNGIDYKTKKEYEVFIATFDKQVTYEQTRWGKEGEIDFCFQLNELSKKEQEDFVNKSKKLLSKSNRIHLYENTPCRHK